MTCCGNEVNDTDVALNSNRLNMKKDKPKMIQNGQVEAEQKAPKLKNKIKAEVTEVKENEKELNDFEEKWDDGAKYRGQHSKDGKRHGEGKFTWKNGDIYNGFFKENNLDGYGVFTWNDGRSYKGNWKGNKFEGVRFYFLMLSMESLNGRMEKCIKGITKMEKNMVMENFGGRMEGFIKEIGLREKCMEKENLLGRAGRREKESGISE